MDVRDARSHFPGLAGKVFLDSAVVGLAPVEACDAVADFLALARDMPARDASSHHIVMDELRATAAPRNPAYGDRERLGTRGTAGRLDAGGDV